MVAEEAPWHASALPGERLTFVAVLYLFSKGA